jgi:hypothetical protein
VKTPFSWSKLRLVNKDASPARPIKYRFLQADQVRFALQLGLLLLLSFGLRLLFLDNFIWGYDEGIHVLLAKLLAADYTPYTQLFVSYPPLFVWSLEWPWRIWQTVAALQLTMTLYALLGLVAVGLIAYRLAGKLAGLLAAFFLSVSATYLDGSRAVMTEVPSVGVAALAVALAAIYYWTGRRGWLFGSGLLLAASLMLKILSPFILALILLLPLVRRMAPWWQQPPARSTTGRLAGDGVEASAGPPPKGSTPYAPDATMSSITAQDIKALLIDGAVFAAGLLLPLGLVLLLYDAEAMFRQVIAFRLDSRITYEDDWTDNIEILLTFGRSNLALILAAAWGFGLIWQRQRRAGWFVPLWLILALAFSLIQVPLREKHLPLLLPPLTTLAGLALAHGLRFPLSPPNRGAGGVQQTEEINQPSPPTRGAGAVWAVALLLAALYFWQLGSDFTAFSRITTQPLNQDEQRLTGYLQRFTSPADCLITDNPTLAFFADRLTPPNLSEVSSARLRTGYLTYDELVAATQTYGCQVVAPVDRRLKRTRADFIEWSKQNFVGLWLYDGGTEILLAQPLANPQPAHRSQVKLGEQVELVGFELIEADQALYVSLYWQALQPLDQDYTVFVHLRDEANQTLANADHQPYDGLVPTSRWPVGRAIKETIRLDLPPDLPKGPSQVMVGMYLPATLERLPVQPDHSGENAIILQLPYNP